MECKMVRQYTKTPGWEIMVQVTRTGCVYLRICALFLNSRITLLEQLCFDDEGRITHSHIKKPRLLRVMDSYKD